MIRVIAFPSALLGAFLVGCLVTIVGMGGFHAQEPPKKKNEELGAALLAVEEAELRERMITALAIAEGVRLRGRTVLVAMSELARVRRAIAGLSAADPNRPKLQARIDALENRRIAVSAIVDQEFDTYVEVVGEIAVELWPRLRRVSNALAEDLETRRLGKLGEMLPLLRAHVEEMNRAGGITSEALLRWRSDVDDTFDRRRDRLRDRKSPETAIPETVEKGDRDI
ncbi:MAG: hypothetical protein AAF074_04790 [Pseudomonadota bacterium]